MIAALLTLGAFGAAPGVCLCDALDDRKPASAHEARQRALDERYSTAKAALLAISTALLLAPFILHQ